jgi:dienelactone hydrolase
MWAALLLSVFATVLSSNSASAVDLTVEPDGELQRGAFFGARMLSVPDEVRDRFKIEAGTGAVIGEVFPGTSAEAAGFKAGDILLAANGAKIAGAVAFTQVIAARKAGAELTIELRRGDDLRKEKVTLKGRPVEKSDDFDITYGTVASRAGRLRTIVTRPKGAGKHPALLFVQGIGLASIDNPMGPLAAYKTIVDDFTRHGFVTLRVDKPGCGDSEGGPGRDVDFDTEFDGYLQALKMLKARGDVDTDRVFIFGHSMGGVMAPLLAAGVPVRGIVVYGTITRTWTEYWLENLRRQMELADTDPSAIDRDLRAEAALSTYLYTERKSPKEIIDRFPNLRDRIEQSITEDRYFFDRSLSFYRQLTDKNLGAAWESFGGHALAIWGKGDFVSNEDDHALIARIVNRDHPGHGTFLAMEGIDHGFNRAASRRESFERGQSRQPGEFNPAIVEVARAWVEKIAAEAIPSALETDPLGWTDLLAQAGPKLEGWARGPLPAQAKLGPRSQWILDPSTGYLLCQGDGGHEWLRWDKELGDFIYHVEWRFTPVAGKKGYNSGIYARNSADARIYHQAQTGDASGGYLFGNTETKGAGQRFNLSKQATDSRVKPAGEWNTFEITCRGPDMTLWVNGGVTNRWHDCEVKRGHVGLEAEGWRIEFRNVKVKTLDDSARAKTDSKG